MTNQQDHPGEKAFFREEIEHHYSDYCDYCAMNGITPKTLPEWETQTPKPKA